MGLGSNALLLVIGAPDDLRTAGGDIADIIGTFWSLGAAVVIR